MRSLAYRTDLMIRRLAGAEITAYDDHVVVRTPHNPDFWWGNFVLLREPVGRGAASRWTDVFAGAFPDARHLALGIDGTDGRPGDAGDVALLGVEVDVLTVLTARGLPPPAVEPAYDCRRLRSDDDWQQLLALRAACTDGDDGSDARVFRERSVREIHGITGAGHGAWFGAFLDGVMRAGLGIFSDRAGVARYQAVETHPDFRRRGLATALLHAAGLHATGQLDAHTLVIVADTGSDALRLYRSLGFAGAERQVQLLRPPEQARHS